VTAREPLVITLRAARRLAVRAQGLDRVPARADVSTIVRTVERIRWLQLDPTTAVAPSHLLVLWSRLGRYDTGTLGRAIWKQGDSFLGDPPMEEQGLNSVFDSDKAIWELVRSFTKKGGL